MFILLLCLALLLVLSSGCEFTPPPCELLTPEELLLAYHCQPLSGQHADCHGTHPGLEAPPPEPIYNYHVRYGKKIEDYEFTWTVTDEAYDYDDHDDP